MGLVCVLGVSLLFTAHCETVVAEPETYTYPRYLRAKKTVDARALNHSVWTEFLNALTEDSSSEIRILEVGGGVGATVQRIIKAVEGRSVDHLCYTFVDVNPENAKTARSLLRRWAEERGYAVSGRKTQVWTGGCVEISIQFVTADLFAFAGTYGGDAFDAIIAQAVLDLFSIPRVLQRLRPLLCASGLWYLPLHFDGVTAFDPPVDPALDAQIERLYHESMRQETREGTGRDGASCGRRLLTHLRTDGAILLEAGASDWVVFARESGYPHDEAYFLHHILHFVETELAGHPDLNLHAFTDWLDERRRQIENDDLIYVAHQLDVLARLV